MRSHVHGGHGIILFLARKPHFLISFDHFCIALNIILILRGKYEASGINVKFIESLNTNTRL